VDSIPLLTQDDLDIERILNSEASLLNREEEVRLPLVCLVSSSSQLSAGHEGLVRLQAESVRGPRARLDAVCRRHGIRHSRVPPPDLCLRAGADAVWCMTLEKIYRKKSLLIHPDKLKHVRGVEAFDLLKKVRSIACVSRVRKVWRVWRLTRVLSSGLFRTAGSYEAQVPR
jgi:hypothetical protein